MSSFAIIVHGNSLMVKPLEFERYEIVSDSNFKVVVYPMCDVVGLTWVSDDMPDHLFIEAIGREIEKHDWIKPTESTNSLIIPVDPIIDYTGESN
jgi:hypothetical protein